MLFIISSYRSSYHRSFYGRVIPQLSNNMKTVLVQQLACSGRLSVMTKPKCLILSKSHFVFLNYFLHMKEIRKEWVFLHLKTHLTDLSWFKINNAMFVFFFQGPGGNDGKPGPPGSSVSFLENVTVWLTIPHTCSWSRAEVLLVFNSRVRFYNLLFTKLAREHVAYYMHA